MPIYAYKCSACGFAKDTLQKMSDAPLTVCPSCGASTFKKQLTAAGFKLKGTGWYVTDFRDESTGKKSGEVPAEHGSHSDSHHSAEQGGAAHAAPASALDAKPAAAGASSTLASVPAPSASAAAPAAKSD